MASDYEIFSGMKLSDVFRDIYTNQINKKKNISELIESLRKLIKTVGEAAVIAPIVKDLIEVSVKNDEHLLKLATIAQRLALAADKQSGQEGYLSEAEKKQLLSEIETTMTKLQRESDEKFIDLEIEIDDLKSKV